MNSKRFWLIRVFRYRHLGEWSYSSKTEYPATALECGQGRSRRGRRLRIILGGLVLAPALLLAVLVARAYFAFPTRQMTVSSPRLFEPCPGYAERLGQALRFRTISSESSAATNAAPFAELASFLEAEFPAVHRELEREVVGGHTLLFRWKGTTASVQPVLLMSHLDVVPVEPGAEKNWTHPPFSGKSQTGSSGAEARST